MRGWRWVLGALALLVLVAVVALRARPRGAEVATAAAGRADLTVPIQCDGTLEPPPGGELRASEPASVAALPVRDGDRVKAGDTLVRLENPELTQKATDARSQALALEADLAELQREAAHHREVFEASRRLFENGAIPKKTYEADELEWRRAEDRLRNAPSRVELARRAAAELDRRVEALTIRTTVAGVVYGLPRRAGEAVVAGQVVASVMEPERRRVRARVDQPDLPQVRPGQKMIVTFDGLPRERWEGAVSFVAPGLREVGGREVGEVLGDIGDPKALLPANAAVEIQIVTGEKAGALVVPRAALLRDGDARFVYTLEDGRARKREVTVGLLGLSEAEIVSGLSEGQTVLLPGDVALSDGLRVRPAKAASR
jgi:HlyD family secretion protein